MSLNVDDILMAIKGNLFPPEALTGLKNEGSASEQKGAVNQQLGTTVMQSNMSVS